MDTPNAQKCNCRNSNPKSSKPVQMISSDSDVFYDVPDDENRSAMPKSSNRSRTSQNDRYRDHTHLSNEPNIEAPAGPRQQPAGQRQTYQAKDKYDAINDDNDDGKNGNNASKEQLSLGNIYHLTPKGSFLCSNVSQDGFSNLPSEAVKLSFSTNARADLQGSYECFCEEKEEENGSCHKFWCQRYGAVGDKREVEDSMRAFRKLIEDKEARDEACCSQQTIFDLKTKPDYECLRERSISKEGFCTGSCKNDEIENQEFKISPLTGVILSERGKDTHQISNALNQIEQKSRIEERIDSNNIEDLRPSGDFRHSGRPQLKKLAPNFNESFYSVGTGITPRPSMDENVIPLLKNIFDVLQTMRDEQFHLGPYASKNIDIHLDEPINGLPLPPPSKSSTLGAPSSSPKFSRQLQGISNGSPFPELKSSEIDHLVLKKEIDQDNVNSENMLAMLEPPERDIEGTSSRPQRLIPVDMNLIRTDEELYWEPDLNFDKPKVEEGNGENFSQLHSLEMVDKPEVKENDDEGNFRQLHSLKIEDDTPSRAQFQQFPVEAHTESTDLLNLPNLKLSSSVTANPESEDYYRKLSNMPLLKKSHQELRLNQKKDNDKIFLSQAVQVNLVSLKNLKCPSAQFSTLQNDELEDLSNEKLLKTSKINKSNETTNSSSIIRTKLDVGTDCPDFDNNNEDKSSIKSYRDSPDPTKTSQNQEMSQFIESILFDLRTMNSFRKNNCHSQRFAKPPCPPTTGMAWKRPSTDLSYPVTIESVQELGANSLFIKWRVQNFGNIGGYEIFLDGYLTNRYFNCLHRAAVICDVDLRCPHRITLRAQPLLQLKNSSCSSLSTSNTKRPSNSTTTTTTHPEASCPQSDGSVWYPSVYHFEPNSLSSSSAPTNAGLY